MRRWETATNKGTDKKLWEKQNLWYIEFTENNAKRNKPNHKHKGQQKNNPKTQIQTDE